MGSFSKNLKEAMDKKGLSSYELAAAIGVSQRMVQMYLNGNKTPSYARLQKIGETLDTKRITREHVRIMNANNEF
jgi:transcriptional regulator with XRE-family HTH domain